MSSSGSSTGFPQNFGVTHAYRTSEAARQCPRTGECTVTIDGNAFCAEYWVRRHVPGGGGSQGYAIYTDSRVAQAHPAYF